MGLEKPIRVETGIQNSATAIAKGQVVIRNAVADGQKCVISTSNAAKTYGIALEASPGQNKNFPVVTHGPCKGLAGGTVTQGDLLMSDGSGNLVTATAVAASSTRNYVGIAAESAASGDLFWVDVQIRQVIYP